MADMRGAVRLPAALEKVYAGIRADTYWEHLAPSKFVGGRGNPINARAFIVGEAPGATEDAKQLPFVGQSGRVLMSLMELAGLSDKDCWITNTVKFRPPGNRTPNLAEIMHAQPELRREFRAVGSPRFLIAVGNVAKVAIGTISQATAPLGTFIAQAFHTKDRKHWIFTQYHPAYGLRGNDKVKEQMEGQWERMAVEMDRLDRWAEENGE